VGVATAQALAFALGVPIVSATSLEVLAHAVAAAGARAGQMVVPVVDARRGEVFVGRFRVGPNGAEPVGEELRQAPEDLVEALRGADETIVFVGNGARRYRHLVGALPGAIVAAASFDHPPVGILAALGVTRSAAGDVHDAASVVPRYLRDADTRINWEHRARRPAVEV
jgi:tRNA threonylcarbamoyladenosine biosynthesis protein TsaB